MPFRRAARTAQSTPFLSSLLRSVVSLAAAVVAVGGARDVAAADGAFGCRPGTLRRDPGDLLAKIQTAYGKVRSLRATFTQASTLSALDASEESSGDVVFAKPGRMRWNYATPEVQVFVVRDDTLRLYQATDRQVVIDDFKDVLLSDLPVAFLAGIGDLSKDFTFVSSCEGPDGTVTELVPKKKKGGGDAASRDALRGFTLLTTPRSYLPKGARVVDVAGNVTAIVLDRIEPDAPVDDEDFVLTPPPGTDVVDRRRPAGASREPSPGGAR